MALDQTANFIRGSTDSSVNSTQTTISVGDASIFPDPVNGEYNLVFWDDGTHPRPDQDPSVEVVRVTGRDTTNDDLTVTRGQESTSGASHPSGSALQLSPTAKMFGDIEGLAVESFTTSGADGTVPTSQGDGTLAMEVSGGNVPNWQEDANSPINISGSQSTTITLSQTYDQILVGVEVWTNTSGGAGAFQVRVDGDSGANYTIYDVTGTATTSSSAWEITGLGDGFSISGWFMLSAAQASRAAIFGPFGVGSGSRTIATGQNTNVTMPIDSITFRESNGTQTLQARVYGWDGGL